LNVIQDQLKEDEENYEGIKKKLRVAFEVAYKNRSVLTQAQRDLVNRRIDADKTMIATVADWIPDRAPEEMEIPEMDPKALQFYQKLSTEDKQKFDDFRRMSFFLICGQHKINVAKHQALPKENNRKDFLLFPGKAKRDGVLASRMAMLALKQKQLLMFDEQNVADFLNKALEQFEKEHKPILEAEQVREIKKQEIERRRRNFQRQKGNEFDSASRKLC
jgi:hypothetical protein